MIIHAENVSLLFPRIFQITEAESRKVKIRMGQSCVRSNDDEDDGGAERRSTKKGSRYQTTTETAKLQGKEVASSGVTGSPSSSSTVQLIPLEHMEHPQSRLVNPSLLDKQFREFSRVFKHDNAALAVAAVKGIPARQRELLCAGEDKSIAVMNFATGHIFQKWDHAHERDINALTSPHPANQTFLSASRDKLVKLWQLGKDDPLCVLRGHNLNVTCVDMSPDGTRAVSGSRDNSVRLWDLNRGEELMNIEIKLNLVHFCKWLPQLHLVAQGGEDLTVRLFDVRSEDEMTLRHTMTGFDYHPICADVSRNGNYLYTGHNGFNGQGSMLIEWDVRMMKQQRVHTGHQFTVRALKVLKSPAAAALGLQDQVFTASDDGTAKFWGVKNPSWTEEANSDDQQHSSEQKESDQLEKETAGGEVEPMPTAGAAISSHELPEGKATSVDESDEGHIIMGLRNGCLLILKPGASSGQVLPVQRYRYVGNPAAN
jgi:WD40 repeat protein